MCKRNINRLSLTPPAGDLAFNTGMCRDWELNQWSLGSQVSTQSTEPHWPGHHILNIYFKDPLKLLYYLFPQI